MPLSSTSTLAEIKAAYADNASYEANDSVSQAQAFIAACRLLLLKLPKRTVTGNRYELELDLDLIRDELEAAKRWASVRGSNDSGNVIFPSFDNFRG